MNTTNDFYTKIQRDFNDTVVEFESFQSNGNFKLSGIGILTLELSSIVGSKAMGLINANITTGDMALETRSGKWEFLRNITLSLSEISPYGHGDVLLTTRQINMKGMWSNISSNAPHQIFIAKHTTLSQEDLAKVSLLRHKSFLTEFEKGFMQRIEASILEHHLQTREGLATFANTMERTIAEKNGVKSSLAVELF